MIKVFLDLKKAWDTVNHKILLKKLYNYGIRGNLNKWFENYLADRYQYVLFNGKHLILGMLTVGYHNVISSVHYYSSYA